MSIGAKTTRQVQAMYDDLAPRWRKYDMVNTLLGINWHRSMFRKATGDVLDVACGTGENFRYLTGADELTAIDLSPKMVAQAQRSYGHRVSVADAQDMPFEDDTFDTVVSAMSSCTFPDYVAAFREMQRVARPGGRIMLMEHGRSSVGWIAKRQDRRGAIKTMERGGCRSNRDIRGEVEAAGLRVVSHKTSHLGMIQRIEIAA